MQAIHTKVLPATNTKPTRIKAKCCRGSLTVAYSGSAIFSSTEAHASVALSLCIKFADEDKARGIPVDENLWLRGFVSGGLPDGSHAHVFVS